MNTRYLLIASSLAMGVAGLAASFAPQELLIALRVAPTAPLPVILQLMGALYVAFAAANWTAKDSLFGGIYARPLALGNCLHFVVGALALGKHAWRSGIGGPLVAVLGGVCGIRPRLRLPDLWTRGRLCGSAKGGVSRLTGGLLAKEAKATKGRATGFSFAPFVSFA